MLSGEVTVKDGLASKLIRNGGRTIFLGLVKKVRAQVDVVERCWVRLSHLFLDQFLNNAIDLLLFNVLRQQQEAIGKTILGTQTTSWGEEANAHNEWRDAHADVFGLKVNRFLGRGRIFPCHRILGAPPIV